MIRGPAVSLSTRAHLRRGGEDVTYKPRPSLKRQRRNAFADASGSDGNRLSGGDGENTPLFGVRLLIEGALTIFQEVQLGQFVCQVIAAGGTERSADLFEQQLGEAFAASM